MIPMICVDQDLGMMFRGRRLLSNKELRARILEISARDVIWMNSYTAEAFAEEHAVQIRVDDDFLNKAGWDDYVLVEDQPLNTYRERIQRVLLYRWEDHCSEVCTLELDLDIDEWLLMVAEDLPTSDGMYSIEVMKP